MQAVGRFLSKSFLRLLGCSAEQDGLIRQDRSGIFWKILEIKICLRAMEIERLRKCAPAADLSGSHHFLNTSTKVAWAFGAKVWHETISLKFFSGIQSRSTLFAEVQNCSDSEVLSKMFLLEKKKVSHQIKFFQFGLLGIQPIRSFNLVLSNLERL